MLPRNYLATCVATETKKVTVLTVPVGIGIVDYGNVKKSFYGSRVLSWWS